MKYKILKLILEVSIDAVDNISKLNDKTTSFKSSTLFSTIGESDFIVYVGCALNVCSLNWIIFCLNYFKGSIYLLEAKIGIVDVLNVLEQKRKYCVEMFAKNFRAAEKTISESFIYKTIVQR